MVKINEYTIVRNIDSIINKLISYRDSLNNNIGIDNNK